MAVETSVERAVLLADFGVSVTYTPVGGTSRAVIGIFDNAYESIEAGGSVSFAVQQPRFLCATANVPGATEGASFVIETVAYIATVVMADGTGMTEFMLEKQ